MEADGCIIPLRQEKMKRHELEYCAAFETFMLAQNLRQEKMKRHELEYCAAFETFMLAQNLRQEKMKKHELKEGISYEGWERVGEEKWRTRMSSLGLPLTQIAPGEGGGGEVEDPGQTGLPLRGGRGDLPLLLERRSDHRIRPSPAGAPIWPPYTTTPG